MGKEKTFIDGMFVKEIEGNYGKFLKLSVDMQKFNNFAKEHGAKSESNGKVYLNIDVMDSREGGKYACLNTWRPNTSDKKEVAPTPPPVAPFDDDDIPF